MNSTRRIALLLTLVFLVPALFFSVYEMSSLTKDEKMIQTIYQKQLDAILFSANQYADDVLSGWTSRIENHFDPSLVQDSVPQRILELLQLNSSLHYIFIKPLEKEQPVKVYGLLDYWTTKVSDAADSIVENDSVITELVRYKRSGFQKISRVNWKSQTAPDLQCLLFVIGEEKMSVVGLLINADEFIENSLGPQLQKIAQDQFILSVLRADESTVYTTATRADTVSIAEAITKDLWILPGYKLGIRTSGTTMQELVRERTRSNMVLLIGLDIILITGVFLVFRNLKREVDLAQNKADFVSNVSHEIRTPLALISMFAETLEMDRAPTQEKKQEYYRIISREAQRLSGIVNKILNFSQTEAKKKTLFPQRLHVDTEMQGILETYHFHLKNKGFEYTYQPAGDLFIKADKEAFTETIINLIDNAMKYSDGTKRIQIIALREEKYACISIRDFGIGISKKDQKYIFDKFYRVPSGDLARTRGTGLGLSLVKQLMDDQGGKIQVSSEPGRGSEFRLYYLLDHSS